MNDVHISLAHVCRRVCRIDLEAGTAGSKGDSTLNFYKHLPIFYPGGCAIFNSYHQCVKVHQASLSITNSQSLLKLMSIESMVPSNHLILCCPLLLLPSIFLNIRVFSYESVLCISWPKVLALQLQHQSF